MIDLLSGGREYAGDFLVGVADGFGGRSPLVEGRPPRSGLGEGGVAGVVAGDGVAQHAQTFDVDLDNVAGLK